MATQKKNGRQYEYERAVHYPDAPHLIMIIYTNLSFIIHLIFILGRVLLKGDNITLIMSVAASQ